MGSHAKVDRWAVVDSARAACGIEAGETPAHAFTIYEYAERYKIPTKTAVSQLERLVGSGKLCTGTKPHKRGAFTRHLRMYWPK